MTTYRAMAIEACIYVSLSKMDETNLSDSTNKWLIFLSCYKYIFRKIFL